MWAPTLYDTTKLTVELREIVENSVESVDIWAFAYPSYYEGEEKKAFEQKVIDHYYNRQIGFETVGRFLHAFRTRIREIMPYYIEMYRTVEIMAGIEDPFGNVDVTETYEETSTGTARGSSSGLTSDTGSSSEDTTQNSTNTVAEDKTIKFSDTPQGSIDNIDKYLTTATKEDNSSTNTLNGSGSRSSESQSATESESQTESSSSGTVKHTLTRKGNQGVNTYAHDMIEFRKSILNVDMMIINELNDLFLGVY